MGRSCFFLFLHSTPWLWIFGWQTSISLVKRVSSSGPTGFLSDLIKSDQMYWLDLFDSGTVLLHKFVGFWMIHFCIEVEGACVLCLLKGAHTNVNKSRNIPWSVPKLSLALRRLSIPLSDSVAQVGYLPLCFSQENLVSATFWNFESLLGVGLSPLPCPEKLCRQALV